MDHQQFEIGDAPRAADRGDGQIGASGVAADMQMFRMADSADQLSRRRDGQRCALGDLRERVGNRVFLALTERVIDDEQQGRCPAPKPLIRDGRGHRGKPVHLECLRLGMPRPQRQQPHDCRTKEEGHGKGKSGKAACSFHRGLAPRKEMLSGYLVARWR